MQMNVVTRSPGPTPPNHALKSTAKRVTLAIPRPITGSVRSTSDATDATKAVEYRRIGRRA